MSPLIPLLQVLAVALPFSALESVLIRASQGLTIMSHTVYVQEIFEPICRLALTWVLILLGAGLTGALWAHVAAAATGATLAYLLLTRSAPYLGRRGVRGQFEAGLLVRYSWPLLIVQCLSYAMVWTDTLMLGYFRSPLEVGLYGAASRTVLLAAIVRTSFNTVFTPMIADLHHRRDAEGLGKSFRTVARWIFTVNLPILLGMAVFAGSIVRCFGAEFGEAAASLGVLSTGWLVYSAVGPVGETLTMTGYQRLHSLNMFALFVLNVTLNALLIPPYGIMGAATATAVSIATFSIFEFVQVWLLLQIHLSGRDLVKPLLAACASLTAGAGFARLMQPVLPEAEVVRGAGGLLVLAVTYCVALAVQGFEADDRAVLRQVRTFLIGGRKRERFSDQDG